MKPLRLITRIAFALLAAALPLQVLAVQGSASTGKPDYSYPPGATNPAVTQANISTTICRPGYTKTIRPPASYTNALKRRQMRERNLPGRPSDYEEDHYVPLEVGGHPRDPKNLWPQPWSQAKLKDKLENALNRAVCGGRLTLTQAQNCLLPDWVACARRMHTPTP